MAVTNIMTLDEMLSLSFEPFYEAAPQLLQFATDLSSDTLSFQKKYFAKIEKMPEVQDFDFAQGFAGNATSANSLYEDVPILVDQFKHVPLMYGMQDAMRDGIDKVKAMERAAANAGRGIAKAMVMSVLAKITPANASHALLSPSINFDRDALAKTRMQLNDQLAAETGRQLLISPDAALALSGDARVASRDFAGAQQTRARVFLQNLEGFENIIETSGLPAGLSGFAFEKRGIVLKAGVPDHAYDLAQQLNVPTISDFAVQQDPDTGLALFAVRFFDPNFGRINTSISAVWGSAVGRQAADNATDSIVDRGVLRITEA